MPAKLMCSPSSTHSRAPGKSPVKECITPRSGPRRCASRSITRTSSWHWRMWTMNGRLGLLRQSQVTIKVVLLHVERGIVPVAVQAGFAQGDDTGLVDQSHDPLPVVGLHFATVVGLDADGGRNHGMTLSQLDGGLTADRGRADRDHGHDTHTTSLLQVRRSRPEPAVHRPNEHACRPIPSMNSQRERRQVTRRSSPLPQSTQTSAADQFVKVIQMRLCRTQGLFGNRAGRGRVLQRIEILTHPIDFALLSRRRSAGSENRWTDRADR